jgi:hypothetical protein
MEIGKKDHEINPLGTIGYSDLRYCDRVCHRPFYVGLPNYVGVVPRFQRMGYLLLCKKS